MAETKGIILSGGLGTRLYPMTKVTSKQLLPVYDKPMVYYPLETLIKGGIKEVLMIVSPEHSGDYMSLLGSGSDFGIKITYEIQDKPAGLGQAFQIGKTFIGENNVAMILGDNIFEDDFSEVIKNFKSGGQVFAKAVKDPERFGVVKFDQNMKAIQITEKPKEYLSDYAITGLYLYDHRVVEIAEGLKPSSRGELEIVDIHNWYLDKGELVVSIVEGEWFDAGTVDSLYEASTFMYNKKHGIT
jgi:glucose-1-phosphate thymidylyltransferase